VHRPSGVLAVDAFAVDVVNHRGNVLGREEELAEELEGGLDGDSASLHCLSVGCDHFAADQTQPLLHLLGPVCHTVHRQDVEHQEDLALVLGVGHLSAGGESVESIGKCWKCGWVR
jgi:hypothetical protein